MHKSAHVFCVRPDLAVVLFVFWFSITQPSTLTQRSRSTLSLTHTPAEMLPLEAVLAYEPALRTRIKADLREVIAKRSAVWRLKDAVNTLSASLAKVSEDMNAVSEQLRVVVDGSLSESASASVDWLDTIGTCFNQAALSLGSLVVQQLEQSIETLQSDIQNKKEHQQKAEKALCAAVHKLAGLQESKASEHVCFAENAKVFEARRAWHAHTLMFCAALNEFGITKRTLVHPALSNILRIFQQLTSRALSPKRLEDALKDIDSDHSTIHAAAADLQTEQQDLVARLTHAAEPFYYLERDPNNPFQAEVGSVFFL